MEREYNIKLSSIEQYFLLPTRENEAVGTLVSRHFINLEKHVGDLENGRQKKAGRYEDEAYEWLKQLEDSQGTIEYEYFDGVARARQTARGVVRKVVRSNDELDKIRSEYKGETPSCPDFMVVLEGDRGSVVAGYEVKSSPRNVKRIAAGDQIRPVTTRNLLNKLPFLRDEVEQIVGSTRFSVEKGHILFPNNPRNTAYFRSIDVLKDRLDRIQFPPSWQQYPYVTTRMNDEYAAFSEHATVSLFPSEAIEKDSHSDIEILSEYLDLGDLKEDFLVFFSNKLKVSSHMEKQSYLISQSFVDVVVPYTRAEVLQVVANGVSELLKRNDSLGSLPDLLEEYRGESILDFIHLLHYELIDKPSRPAVNSSVSDFSTL